MSVNPDDGRPWTIVVDELAPKQPGFIAREVAFLKTITNRQIKATLPAPALLGERMWDPDRSSKAYPTREAFVHDCVPILRNEIELLRNEGVAIVQIDDPHLCLFVDEHVRDKYDDPDAAADFAVEMTNQVVEGFDDIKLAVHLCRRAGARVRGESAHRGGYDPIIKQLNRLKVNHLTMEFTTPGAGDMSVFQSLRDDIEIGLGCVSCHPGEIDSADDVVSMADRFADLEDPRSTVNRRHLLGDLIVICICGVLAGADGPKAIGVWAQANADWLRRHLPLPSGIPSHDTIGRLLAALKPAAFQSCFADWIRSLRKQDEPTDAREQPAAEVIAIDGKALRRSHDRKHNLGPLFLVSAWSVQHGISLGQLATEEKSNEITAIPELIDNIDIAGATVTIDAAGCQKQIAAKIIDGRGDYVLALKGNQGNLHQAVRDWIIAQTENDFADVTVRRYEETVKGHGRVDQLMYFQFRAPDTLPGRTNWKRLRTIGVAIRVSRQGDKETSEVRYFISSLRLGREISFNSSTF